ncbi:hypothetical protein [Serratia inhibens]|uniref:Uncharacterized protein n=1 Tax=Serratia inhibens TaxID=2338073 RepID=A0AA92X379_9GAMM|nr:hypothetical protein [Serratia inhibens]ANS44784.1 3-methyl-L-tyrosine peroxygenase [Serratia inhibens PRI-2C]RJF54070.1 hypothetical protein D4100_19030 [Serratia inhibens]
MNTPELTRWKVGHKLFTLFIQAALCALHSVEEYFLQNNRFDGVISLKNAASMMRMSALAMKYSADFQKGKYESIIRPSMPDRFSGLGSMDHAYLIKVMARIKKNKEQMREFFGEAYDDFVVSVQQAYDAHIFVCERFVENQNSLRSTQLHPASEVLTEFKIKRLSFIQPKE